MKIHIIISRRSIGDNTVSLQIRTFKKKDIADQSFEKAKLQLTDRKFVGICDTVSLIRLEIDTTDVETEIIEFDCALDN